jgi:CheY-like chemotaxis protein
VVLCDIGLPRLAGFGVARALRQGEARLVAITASGDEETCRQARESGFDHFLVKPVDPVRILQLLA